jgi:hypothetical protein
MPQAGGQGTWQVAAQRAHEAGLRTRAIAETVGDTWMWLQAGDPVSEYRAELRPTGLDPKREKRLLSLLGAIQS